MRVLIASGGTGGHLFPALALASAVEQRWPESQVRITITGRPLEHQIVTRNGRQPEILPLLPLADIRRSPLRLLLTLRDSWKIADHLLADMQPNVVVGTGGWSMAPVLMRLPRRMPYVLLEQNAVAGRSTQRYAKKAAAVCLALEAASGTLPQGSQIVVTGNPVRTEISDLVKTQRDPNGSLLVLGGSQGAKGVNEAMLAMARFHPGLLKSRPIVHQAGSEEAASELRGVYEQAGLQATVAPFFEEMAERYSQAGLVIARAGATTLAEVACAGIPSLLIPYPYASDQHQQLNANVYEQAGAALTVRQQEDGRETADGIARELQRLQPGSQVWSSMNAAMQRMARPEAANDILDVLDQVVQGPR